MITFSGPFFDLSLPTQVEREALLLQAIEYERLIQAKMQAELDAANLASVTESLAAFGI